MMRPGAARLLILGAVLFQALAPCEASAQTLWGRLLDMASGTPVVLARVSLLDADGQPVTFTITDTGGEFLLVAPEVGEYWIKAESEFYEEYSDGPISFSEADTVWVSFGLKPNAVVLDEIVVEARRRHLRLTLGGVYERREAGIGRHFDRQRIRSRPGRPVSELIQLLPNVVIRDGEPIFIRQQFQRIGKQVPACYPQVFLNEMILAIGGSVPSGIGRFPLNHLEAIEVYTTDMHLPGRFAGANSRCGTIVLWTR